MVEQKESSQEIKTVLFSDGLMVPVLKGEKLISLRKYREEAHKFNKGEYFVGNFNDGLDILLEVTADTEIRTFGDLTDEVAIEDGFESASDAFEKMGKYYPDLNRETQLGIIRFKVPQINGYPVVSANKHLS